MPQENGDVILQGHADRAFDRFRSSYNLVTSFCERRASLSFINHSRVLLRQAVQR